MPDTEPTVDPKKVRVCIAVEPNPNDPKTSLHFLKWIQSGDDKIVYEFPSECQLLNVHHKSLLQVPTIKSVLKSLTKRGSYRIVSTTLPTEIVPMYFDGDGNVVFQEFFLPEKDFQTWKSDTVPPTSKLPSTATPEVTSASLLEVLQKLASGTGNPQQATPMKKMNLTKVKADFVLDNFDGKNSEVGRWLDAFLRECTRCQVNNSEDKILILRLFMEGSAKNWYASALIELGLNREFIEWETKMREAFKEQGWKKIREAYNFKYLGGQYVDYVLRKQNLLLEQEHAIDKKVQINLIVVGLPVHIQDKLDRSKINSIEELLGELRKVEPSPSPSQKNSPNNEQKNKKAFVQTTTNDKKKPCNICAKLGHLGRFHPEAVCRNRLGAEKKEGSIRTVNNMEIQETLNESITDQKN